MYKNRTLSLSVAEASKYFKVVLLTGMRQVGKTTFFQHISDSKRKYVSLDNPKILLLAKKDPELFFQEYKPPVLIDEVQYAPELFPYIKMIVDNSDKNGQIWLTGSQQYSMMKNITESLAGRVAIIDMFGFSIYERENRAEFQKPFLPSINPPSLLRKKDVKETFETIWLGSYPKIVDYPEQAWSLFYDSYLKTYIERDVRQLINIVNESSFVKFISVAAARTAQELNLSDIADNADITLKTASKWLSILETSGIVYLLKPYYKNISKRFTKRPKIYFLDTGLCAYLTEWNNAKSLETGAMSGAFFETFAIVEIIKSYKHNGLNPSLYFYRDSNKVEIDLLIYQNGLLYPIEIKKTANPQKEHIKAFETLSKIADVGYGSLICLASQKYPITEKANAVSIWDI
ncbi:MAG: ATP-binding protein [Elusimicrobiota bacterium]|jgi:predicted AAA+ superfamily ATPase|nr:ATP-binding protein [Elusimicrobiota bacterium]